MNNYKVIRIKTKNGGNFPETLKIKRCDGSVCNYHVFLIKKGNSDDMCLSPYNFYFDPSCYKEHLVAKTCYSTTCIQYGVWKVIGTTLFNLDMPSLDESIIDLVRNPEIEEYSFEAKACDFCGHIRDAYTDHLYDGESMSVFNKKANDISDQYTRMLSLRLPCNFFTSILPYKSAPKDIKYFWKNNKLFVLRRYNNKIYEGYQWLKLSEEEKEQMLK